MFARIAVLAAMVTAVLVPVSASAQVVPDGCGYVEVYIALLDHNTLVTTCPNDTLPGTTTDTPCTPLVATVTTGDVPAEVCVPNPVLP